MSDVNIYRLIRGIVYLRSGYPLEGYHLLSCTVKNDTHNLLVRAGFLRQGYSGIFHFLPLGVRVQEKLERLIEKYMGELGASKISLSTVSSEQLWRRSGRLQDDSTEFFRFRDRKDVRFLLSPTHEEEITHLVADLVKSYKETPLRLFQISRKYRDERRPRQGLLRTREFVMKDLYTFDSSPEAALESYEAVRSAYASLFGEFKIPYLVASADSGNMGGKLSHEFHFPASKGEDVVVSCDSCSYVANEEVARRRPNQEAEDLHSQPATYEPAERSDELVKDVEEWSGPVKSTANDTLTIKISTWTGVTRDRLTLVNVFFPSPAGAVPGQGKENEINIFAVKRLIPELDSSFEDPVSVWRRVFRSTTPKSTDSASSESKHSSIVNIFDRRLSQDFSTSTFSNHADVPKSPESGGYFSKQIPTTSISRHPETGDPLDLVRIKHGDQCPQCIAGALQLRKAVELGHTFHLGTRYSEPLRAKVSVPVEVSQAGPEKTGYVALQMGCHGIGVSRIIGAVADILSDEKGLNWPRVISPFEVTIIAQNGLENDAEEVYDLLTGRDPQSAFDGVPASIDAVLDDRHKDLPWKLKDADLIGYPVIVVLGRAWKREKNCEVQCRRLDNLKVEVHVTELRGFVDTQLQNL